MEELTKLSYPGRDLEAMSFAIRYHRWILEIFKPYLKGSVVEVGAGSGLFSELLAQTTDVRLTLIEPSSQMFPILKNRLANRKDTEFYQDFFTNVATRLKPAPDTIVYVNVLEHISDDTLELQIAYDTLKPGGYLLLFVPALRALYGALDKEIGHFRRYHLKPLVRLCRSVGFEVSLAQYFDFLGIVPWWLNFKLLKSNKINPMAVKLYDTVVVPFEKPLETLVRPPIGKNILVIARKPR